MNTWIILFLVLALAFLLSLTFFALTETDSDNITANVAGGFEQRLLSICQVLCIVILVGSIVAAVTASTMSLRLISCGAGVLALISFCVIEPILSPESVFHMNFFVERCNRHTMEVSVQLIGALSNVSALTVAVIGAIAIRGLW